MALDTSDFSKNESRLLEVALSPGSSGRLRLGRLGILIEFALALFAVAASAFGPSGSPLGVGFALAFLAATLIAWGEHQEKRAALSLIRRLHARSDAASRA